MPIIEQDLDFETHLREYGAYLKGTANEDAPWHHKAQLVHCCSVIQAIGDLQSEIGIVGQKIGPGKVYHQLVYGAAYRSKIIWTAARTLLNLIPPHRTEVLPHDEVFEVARALNDIYIHIRGMLDNYAWALIHLGDSDNLKKLRPVEVSLFTTKLLHDETLLKYMPTYKRLLTGIRSSKIFAILLHIEFLYRFHRVF